MIYLYWYLGIGAVVLFLMLAFNKLTKKKDDNSLNDVLADLGSERHGTTLSGRDSQRHKKKKAESPAC